MAAAPLTIKLRCKSWAQLKAIYTRDLSRSAVFLKSNKPPPPLATRVRIDLTLPSDSLVVLNGSVSEHVAVGGRDGRGPGVDIALGAVPQSAMWLIESALRSAKSETAAARAKPAAAAPRATTEPPPSLEDGEDVVSAEDDLIAALKQEHASLRRMNPFQILDVDYEASDEAVRAAFGQLTRKYHPDRFARYQSQDARKFASEIFILIRDAYRKLGTAKVRAQTKASLLTRAESPTRGTRGPAERATPAPTPTSAPAPSAAPGVIRDVRSGPAAAPAFTDRTPSASQPIELEPARRSHGPAKHTDAEENLTAGDLDGAHEIYQRAARRDPGDRVARAGVELIEGLRALAARDRLEAAQRFEAVLELDPSNERAARELAEMRRIATNERKGLLARLLGKKE
jgi:curved DNA-binding protein CbpA